MVTSDEKSLHYYTKGLIVPLLSCLGGSYLYNYINIDLQQPIKALIVGAITGIIAFITMTYIIKEKDPLSSSILCGLLTAEVLVFNNKFPTMAGITLWLFFYFHSVEH